MKDYRTEYVPIGCGECIECRKQKARAWQVRLSEEIRTDSSGAFVTLTFSEDELTKLHQEAGDNVNDVAKLAVKRWRERVRKKYGKSPKHWLITELGQDDEATHRIHLHGIIWGLGDIQASTLTSEHWCYGWVDNGKYVNNRTINYIIKYCTKVDHTNENYKPIILCSPGIGKQYLSRKDAKNNLYQADQQTNETYRLPNGSKINLPIYYRNAIYTEEEREKLWLQKLDKKERFVLGNSITINNKKDFERFKNMQEVAREKNARLGYGKRKDYNEKAYIKDLETISREIWEN
ncbi:MAG: hypothetical protein K2K11_03330 [Bacteroidales bacterium]|nr:hypothetical protein [Bacteroidales bacterium]